MPLCKTTMDGEFHRARKEGGVKRITVHDLRHTCVTLLLLACVPPHVVQRRLRHSKVEITLDLYALVLRAMQADAASRPSAVVARITCPAGRRHAGLQPRVESSTGALAAGRLHLGLEARTFLNVGVLGGFTTFSSFSFDTLALARDGHLQQAASNVVGQVALSLLGVWAGFRLAS
jgi:hypothetical protein